MVCTYSWLPRKWQFLCAIWNPRIFPWMFHLNLSGLRLSHVFLDFQRGRMEKNEGKKKKSQYTAVSVHEFACKHLGWGCFVFHMKPGIFCSNIKSVIWFICEYSRVFSLSVCMDSFDNLNKGCMRTWKHEI